MARRSVAGMTHLHHALDYIELRVTDLAATRRFYEAAFGWQFNDYGPAYAGIRVPDGEGEVGGLDATTAPTPGGPLVLLFSDDLDASVAAVRRGRRARWSRSPTSSPAAGASTSPTPAATSWGSGRRRDEA